MAKYTIDPEGVIHVVSDDPEFTFCSMECGCGGEPDGWDVDKTEYGKKDFGAMGEFDGKSHFGPANCEACQSQIRSYREASTGAKWSHKMTMPINS